MENNELPKITPEPPKVEEEKLPDTTVTVQAPPPTNNKKKKIIILALILTALVALGAYFLGAGDLFKGATKKTKVVIESEWSKVSGSLEIVADGHTLTDEELINFKENGEIPINESITFKVNSRSASFWLDGMTAEGENKYISPHGTLIHKKALALPAGSLEGVNDGVPNIGVSNTSIFPVEVDLADEQKGNTSNTESTDVENNREVPEPKFEIPNLRETNPDPVPQLEEAEIPETKVFEKPTDIELAPLEIEKKAEAEAETQRAATIFLASSDRITKIIASYGDIITLKTNSEATGGTFHISANNKIANFTIVASQGEERGNLPTFSLEVLQAQPQNGIYEFTEGQDIYIQVINGDRPVELDEVFNVGGDNYEVMLWDSNLELNSRTINEYSKDKDAYSLDKLTKGDYEIYVTKDEVKPDPYENSERVSLKIVENNTKPAAKPETPETPTTPDEPEPNYCKYSSSEVSEALLFSLLSNAPSQVIERSPASFKTTINEFITKYGRVTTIGELSTLMRGEMSGIVPATMTNTAPYNCVSLKSIIDSYNSDCTEDFPLSIELRNITTQNTLNLATEGLSFPSPELLPWFGTYNANTQIYTPNGVSQDVLIQSDNDSGKMLCINVTNPIQIPDPETPTDSASYSCTYDQEDDELTIRGSGTTPGNDWDWEIRPYNGSRLVRDETVESSNKTFKFDPPSVNYKYEIWLNDEKIDTIREIDDNNECSQIVPEEEIVRQVNKDRLLACWETVTPKRFADIGENYYAADVIETVASIASEEGGAITIGYEQEDSTRLFKPNSSITRAEAGKMALYAACLPALDSSGFGFKDVKRSDWYYDIVNALGNSGVATGYNDKTFRPNNNITRAEFASMLVKLYKEKDSNFKMSRYRDGIYVDTKEGEFWSEAAITLHDLGIMRGSKNVRGENVFGPDRNITRAETAVIINNFLAKLQEFQKVRR